MLSLIISFHSMIYIVMAKNFYVNTTLLKEADQDDDNVGADDAKEAKDEETERKILGKGIQLLKRLISIEVLLREVKKLNSFVAIANKVEGTLKLN